MDDGATDKVTIEVSKVLVDRAEEVGVDVARVIERALRDEVRQARKAAMTDAEREKLLQQIGQEIAWRNEMIDQDGLFGQEWRTF